MTVCMVPFTAQAHGPYFHGRTIGECVDTKKIPSDGTGILSARYMLKGVDCADKPCKVFIENNGSMDAGCVPAIVTDSEALQSWETAPLSATVTPADGGVTVRIFKQ